MPQVENSVFISHRQTNYYHALAIYQNLSANGYDVFFNADPFRKDDLGQLMLNQIAARAHFVVILTPSALEYRLEYGDELRKQTEQAIDLKRNIVPILFEGFRFSDLNPYLTGKLAALKNYPALTLSAEDFDAALEKLRNEFLNIPLETALQPTPEADFSRLAAVQAKAASQIQVRGVHLRGEAHHENANKLYHAQDLDGAINGYTQAIQLYPDYAQAYNNRGVTRASKGDLNGAIADYAETLRINPNLADTYYNRGNVGKAKGDLNSAISDYTQALLLNPQHTLAYIGRGNAQSGKGDLDAAITDYTQAIQLNPGYATAYNNRGLVYQAKKDLDAAIADYTQAIQLNPEEASAYYNRASLYQAKGDLDAAIADYTHAMEVNNPALYLAYNNRGIVYKSKGDLDAAIADYTQAIQLNPRYENAYVNRGNGHYIKGDLDAAMADYEAALGINPNHELAKKNLRIAGDKKAKSS